jgi:hypothetical protein
MAVFDVCHSLGVWPMLRRNALAAALAATVVATPAIAQQQQPGSDSVVVQGQRVEDAVRDFVAEIGEAPDGENMARWDRRVCVGVFNMTPDYAQKLVDRVSLVAAAVGLEPGEPGCRANVLIMADADGDALAKRLVEDHLRKLKPASADGASTLGREALKQFQSSHAPVRWWHVGMTVLTDTGQAVERGRAVPVRGASRLRKNVRQDLSRVLIILDTSRIGSVSLASLGDYVAMATLAQLDADADTSEFPTVLNLFANKARDRTLRMTQWDLDYLVALYEVPGDAVTANREQTRIARQMLDRQSDPERVTGR